MAQKVKYYKKRQEMSEFNISYVNGEYLFGAPGSKAYEMAFSKSRHWKHEKEWRVCEQADRLKLDPATGLYFFPFGNWLKLREILIGFRCEEKNIERRFKTLITQDPDTGDPDPPEIVRTRRSPTTFAIEKAT